MLKKAVCALAMLPGLASAETLTCPVGGEPFAAPQATVCEATASRSMLLMPLDCPPATIPQCPQNFLPMYKAFSAEDLMILEPYMQSESYESNVDFSPYYLAYIIEKYLSGPDKSAPARLLLQGLWQDPQLVKTDPEYISALVYEIEQTMAAALPDQKARMLALLGFIRFIGGDLYAADRYLVRSEQQPARADEVRAYIAAVRRCLATPEAAHCRATAAIPPL